MCGPLDLQGGDVSRAKAAHLVEHHCAAVDDCECYAACRIEGCEIQETGIRQHVTCKNCLRSIGAEQKRKAIQVSRHIAACKAWADEARGHE